MKANYHTHTARCLHAGGTEEDYILSALREGVDILGFSDHGPFEDTDYGYRMPFHELPEYIDTLNEMAKKYENKIILRKGLEIEYLPKYLNYYEQLLTNLDYLLLGEHFYCSKDGSIHNITKARTTEDYLEYANAIKEALSTGYFKVVAHPDLFTINETLIWDANCDRATDIILNAVLKTNTVLEYNANGLRRGIHSYPDGNRYQYPHNNFWLAAKASSIHAIVGSDCHNPNQVWDDVMKSAIENLKSLGIEPLEKLDL